MGLFKRNRASLEFSMRGVSAQRAHVPPPRSWVKNGVSCAAFCFWSYEKYPDAENPLSLLFHASLTVTPSHTSQLHAKRGVDLERASICSTEYSSGHSNGRVRYGTLVFTERTVVCTVRCVLRSGSSRHSRWYLTRTRAAASPSSPAPPPPAAPARRPPRGRACPRRGVRRLGRRRGGRP